MTRIAVGVIGHVDHGKTALVRVLTGMETDRLPEEKRRGISIALGFAHMRAGEAEIDLIDVPGHERFVRTMVSGATGVAAVILVVAANEGLKPQTVEHVDICAMLAIPRALVVVSKSDLVGPEQALAAGRAACELAAAAGMATPPPILTSAETSQGVEALRAALAELAGAGVSAAEDGFPYLPIDRAFTVAGHGTVVTGTLRRGPLDAQSSLTLTPGGAEVRIRALQAHGTAVEHVAPGRRVAVNLRGVEAGSLGRGDALAPAGLLQPSRWLTVELRATPGAPPLKTGAHCTLLFATTEVEARVRLLDRETLEPGETALAQLNAVAPVCTPARERFILRSLSPVATVGGGRILDPQAQRLRRNDAAVLESLTPLLSDDPRTIVSGMLVQAGAAGVALARLAGLAGLSLERTRAAVDPGGAVFAADGVLMARPVLDGVKARLLSHLERQLEAQPNGVARRRLDAALPDVGAAVMEAAIAELCASGRVQQAGGSLRLTPGAAEAKARGAREAALLVRVESLFRDGGLSPPDPAQAAPTPDARRALDRLVREGVAIRTYDKAQKREILFHREAVEIARATLRPLLGEPGLLVKEAGSALGVSRKYSVPLLEYLDAVQFTRRLGDRRVLGRAASL